MSTESTDLTPVGDSHTPYTDPQPFSPVDPRRHRKTCVCDPQKLPERTAAERRTDERLCIAHGTASYLAQLAVAAAEPGKHVSDNPDVCLSVEGGRQVWDIKDTEWFRAPALRTTNRRAGRPTAHLDVYLAVVRPLLPAYYRAQLDTLIAENTPTGDPR